MFSSDVNETKPHEKKEDPEPKKNNEQFLPVIKCITISGEKIPNEDENPPSAMVKISNELAALSQVTESFHRSQEKVKHSLWVYSASNVICYILVFVLFCIFFLATLHYDREIEMDTKTLMKEDYYYNTTIEMLKLSSGIAKLAGFMMYMAKDEAPKSTAVEQPLLDEDENDCIEKLKKTLIMDALVSRLNPVKNISDLSKLNFASGVEALGPNATLDEMADAISRKAVDNKVNILLGEIDLGVSMGIQVGDKDEADYASHHQYQILQILDDDGLFVKFESLTDLSEWPNMAVFCLLHEFVTYYVGYYQVQEGRILQDPQDGSMMLHFGTFVLGSSDYAQFATANNTLKYAFILYNSNSSWMVY